MIKRKSYQCQDRGQNFVCYLKSAYSLENLRDFSFIIFMEQKYVFYESLWDHLWFLHIFVVNERQFLVQAFESIKPKVWNFMLSTCFLFTELFQSMRDVFSTDLFTILLFYMFSVLLLFAYLLVFAVTFVLICPDLIPRLGIFCSVRSSSNLILLFPIDL